MKRKHQIFISSTFSDLVQERQACVEAILRAGHIPAGMELFSAGNESQLDTIKRWIDDSDIYMLILGGRYGTIEPKTGLSYTEIEYRYAMELNKPFFSIVMTDALINTKVKNDGKKILELVEPKKYQDFKDLVLSKTSRFFDNNSDIKLAILESIIDIQNRNTLTGWVKANEIPDTTIILNQISELTEKNKGLEQELRIIESGRIDKIGDFSFEELKSILEKIKVTIPKSFFDSGEDVEADVLVLFKHYGTRLSIGINNRLAASEEDMFIINNLVSHLRIYELAEIVKVANVAWSKFQTSKLGNKFLAMYFLKENI